MVVMLITAGERLCAIALREVREVMRPRPTEPLPTSLPFVDGVAVIRGEPVPVLDLARLLGAGGSARRERFLTLRVGPRTVALAVDSVLGVRTLDDAVLAELPPLLRDAGPAHVDRLSQLDSELVVVLGGAHTVPDAVWAALRPRGGAT